MNTNLSSFTVTSYGYFQKGAFRVIFCGVIFCLIEMSSSTSDRLRKIAPVTTIAPIPFKSEKWIRKDRKNTELRPLCEY